VGHTVCRFPTDHEECAVPPKYLTVTEVAEQLQVHPQTVRTMARRGELPSFRIRGGRRAPLRFDQAKIDATVAKWERAPR
jgi:excisionase family DNA binding protein